MGVPFVEEEKEVEEDFAETASSVAWDLIPFSVLSRRESNPIKNLRYDPDQPDRRLSLTASAF